MLCVAKGPSVCYSHSTAVQRLQGGTSCSLNCSSVCPPLTVAQVACREAGFPSRGFAGVETSSLHAPTVALYDVRCSPGAPWLSDCSFRLANETSMACHRATVNCFGSGART